MKHIQNADVIRQQTLLLEACNKLSKEGHQIVGTHSGEMAVIEITQPKNPMKLKPTALKRTEDHEEMRCRYFGCRLIWKNYRSCA